MNAVTEADLILLSVEEAKAVKWAAGQVKYGPVFQGDPLAHLYSELIDAMNYADVALKHDVIGRLTHLRLTSTLEVLAYDVENLYRKNHGL